MGKNYFLYKSFTIYFLYKNLLFWSWIHIYMIMSNVCRFIAFLQLINDAAVERKWERVTEKLTLTFLFLLVFVLFSLSFHVIETRTWQSSWLKPTWLESLVSPTKLRSVFLLPTISWSCSTIKKIEKIGLFAVGIVLGVAWTNMSND